MMSTHQMKSETYMNNMIVVTMIISYYFLNFCIFSYFSGASSSRLGLIAIVTIGILCSLIYMGYSYRRRRQLRSIPPPMTFSISEFHDIEDEGQQQNSTSVSNDNWRRPPRNDRRNLVENMDA